MHEAYPICRHVQCMSEWT